MKKYKNMSKLNVTHQKYNYNPQFGNLWPILLQSQGLNKNEKYFL